MQGIPTDNKVPYSRYFLFLAQSVNIYIAIYLYLVQNNCGCSYYILKINYSIVQSC